MWLSRGTDKKVKHRGSRNCLLLFVAAIPKEKEWGVLVRVERGGAEQAEMNGMLYRTADVVRNGGKEE